nr:putative reverse transcriptase domain-containing protein [Tanacetum cinerariifolium]
MIFNINSAMKHSYSNDDTCFNIDVVDEILVEDLDALLDEESKILHSIVGTILEEKLFAKFDEFMAMTAEEPPFKKVTFDTDYKIKTSLEEPSMDIEFKLLPDNLEYVFLEETSFLSVIISSQLSEENKNKLIKEAQKEDSEIWTIVENLDKQVEFRLDDDNVLWQDTRLVGERVIEGPEMIEVTNAKVTVDARLVVLNDATLREALLTEAHSLPFSVHPDSTKMYHDLKQYFWWSGIKRDVATFVARCLICQQVKIEHQRANAHLVLNWENVTLWLKKELCEHKVSEAGRDVDKAKIDAISKLPPPTNIKDTNRSYGLRKNNVHMSFWCMLAIFDMIDESFKVFMDDFSFFGSSFDHCLNNLNKMLQRCEDAHLVLNWENVTLWLKKELCEHKVSEAGRDVDKAKIDAISKLPPPSNIKGIENVVADHLSRIEKEETSDDSEVDDNFSGETLIEINTKDDPWFADFVNYLKPSLAVLDLSKIMETIITHHLQTFNAASNETAVVLDEVYETQVC